MKRANLVFKPVLVVAVLATLMIGGCGNETDDVPKPKDKPKDIPSEVVDVDGNVYPTISIGDQVWLAKNLRTTRYNDGTNITLHEDSSFWRYRDTEAYCWYKNLEVNGNVYGALYNWYAVETGKLCPAGWHVPTHDEWTQLTTTLGGLTFAGGKMKETGFVHWDNQNTGATNSSGFTALPGGYRHGDDGSFYNLGNFAAWWSSTEYSSHYAYYRGVYSHFNTVDVTYYDHGYGFSVRCLMD